jgi:hypothetical protein
MQPNVKRALANISNVYLKRGGSAGGSGSGATSGGGGRGGSGRGSTGGAAGGAAGGSGASGGRPEGRKAAAAERFEQALSALAGGRQQAGEGFARRQSMRASCGGPSSMAAASRGIAEGGDSGGGGGGSKKSGAGGSKRWVKVPCSCGLMCRVVHAAAGGNHSTVLTACGAVMTTGSNSYGQCGHGNTRKRWGAAQLLESS